MQISKGKAQLAATNRASRQTKPNSVKKGNVHMDDTTIISNSALTVPFHGTELYVIAHNDEPYTPLKPIVTGMGLTWHGQFLKLKSNAGRWGILELRIPTKSGVQAMMCMPLRKLPAWLCSIEVGKIKKHQTRDVVTSYQNECDDALWDYWNKGIAINPRAFKRGAGDVLTVEEADMLRETLERDAKMLYKDSKQQGAFIRQGWSKLKAHFGVTYRMIPRNELTTAISILQRHGLQAQANDSEFTVPLNSGSEARFVKEVAVRYLDGYQKAIREGYEPPVIESIPPDVLQGIVVSQMENFRMMICFDTDTMQLTRRLVDQDSIVINPDNESQVKGFICEAVPKAMYPMIVGQIARYYQEVAKLQQRQASKQLLVA